MAHTVDRWAGAPFPSSAHPPHRHQALVWPDSGTEPALVPNMDLGPHC